jgi:hypothetical protein
LPDAAGVDEILFGRLDANVFGPFLPHALIANKYHGHVCVAEKADCGALICETRDSVEVAKYITPLAGRIECSMHDRKIVYPFLQWQAAQPFFVLIRQIVAGPLNSELG